MERRKGGGSQPRLPFDREMMPTLAKEVKEELVVALADLLLAANTQDREGVTKGSDDDVQDHA